MKAAFPGNAAAGRWFRFALCLLAILAFGGLIIWPENRRARELDDAVRELRERIRSQEMLFPLYQANIAEIQRLKGFRVLPVPDPAGADPPAVRDAMDGVRRRATDHGFSISAMSPDVPMLNAYDDRLVLEVRMTGPFARLRELFLALGRLPYVVHFESLEVRGTSGREDIRFRLWLLRG